MAGMSNFAFATDNQKININTATVKELVKLKRIGPKYAERIIKYREENGPLRADTHRQASRERELFDFLRVHQ